MYEIHMIDATYSTKPDRIGMGMVNMKTEQWNELLMRVGEILL